MIEPSILPYTYWCVNSPDDNGSVKLNMDEQRILELAYYRALSRVVQETQILKMFPNSAAAQSELEQAQEELEELRKMITGRSEDD